MHDMFSGVTEQFGNAFYFDRLTARRDMTYNSNAVH